MDVEIALPASKTKTGKARDIPIGGKLAAILEMRAYTPDGTKLGPDAYVFGNEVGEQIKSTRKSWTTCVLRAHGHEPDGSVRVVCWRQAAPWSRCATS